MPACAPTLFGMRKPSLRFSSTRLNHGYGLAKAAAPASAALRLGRWLPHSIPATIHGQRPPEGGTTNRDHLPQRAGATGDHSKGGSTGVSPSQALLQWGSRNWATVPPRPWLNVYPITIYKC